MTFPSPGIIKPSIPAALILLEVPEEDYAPAYTYYLYSDGLSVRDPCSSHTRIYGDELALFQA
jgi:hypothetical protein